MKIKKQFILGFILIVLLGVGLLIGGIVRNSKNSDMIETEATVVSVEIRTAADGTTEFRPFSVRYFVDGKPYETSVYVWFNYPIIAGDTLNIRYKKDDPTYTVVSNVSRQTFSYALMGIGGALIFAGVALTGKYLYDVSRKKGMKNDVSA